MLQRCPSLRNRLVLLLTAGMLAAQSVGAQSSDEGNTRIIRFAAIENLRSDDAAGILARRLELNATTDALQLQYAEHPGDGLEVKRFNQYFKGIRVSHGSFSMTAKNGIASYALGRFYHIDPATSVAPALSEEAGLSKAVAAIGAKEYEWEQTHTGVPHGELQLVEDYSYGQPDGTVHLAYAFEIAAAEPVSRTRIYVDAQNGRILFRESMIQTVAAKAASLYSDTVTFEATAVGSLYVLHDLTRGNGVFTYDLNHSTSIPSTPLEISSTSLLFPKTAAIDAHWAVERAYDYWKNVRNRNSWNGANGALKAYVHYGSGIVNAFWSGNAMNFGDGSGGYSALVSMDVCAHEMGHGVCQSTAGLTYSAESGGMNEGFSDIWGNVIEHWADPHETDAVAKNTWLVGEELGTPLRSMKNPKAYGQPDTYKGLYWSPTTGAGLVCDGTNDNCGVHTNSGILNYWFYLMSVGGKGTNDLGNAYKVPSIGIDTAARVVYATELALNNASDYASCRTASIASATAIYGSCSPVVEAVTRAWYAVGVGADFVPGSTCNLQVSFAAAANNVDENGHLNACPASHNVNVPVTLNGAAALTGSATVTGTIVGGTAVAGKDYDATAPLTATFSAGGATTQNIALKIYDNGEVNGDRYVDMAYTLSATGSNAVKSVALDTTRVYFNNDDAAPAVGDTQFYQPLSSIGGNLLSTPFNGVNKSGHSMFIYRADELRAAGLHGGLPISGIDFFVNAKNSTQPFNGFTVKMANTTTATLANGAISASYTTVYSGNYSTDIGPNSLYFTTPFVWNGTDNIVMEYCFSNSTASTDNDRVQVQTGPYAFAAVTGNNSASACGLPFAATDLVPGRPTIAFHEYVPAPAVATAKNSTRTWSVAAGTDNYFYTADANAIIAEVTNPNQALGCLAVTVAEAGKGFSQAMSGGALRTWKSWSLIPATAATSPLSYTATFYVKTDELGGEDPNKLNILATSTMREVDMTAANTEIITPASGDIIYGDGYIGFKGHFTQMGRAYLVKGKLALDAATVAHNSNGLWTGANPFADAPVLNWTLGASEAVSVRLLDMTGKTVYSANETLAAGSHSMKLSSGADFAAGTYMLQVVRASSVFTQKMLKQ